MCKFVHEYTRMNYLELRTSDDWRLCEGSEAADMPLQNLPVLMQDTLYGELPLGRARRTASRFR